MSRRVLIAEPNGDVRTLLELTVERLGYQAVRSDGPSACNAIDAIILEPACSVGRSLVSRFGADAPPVICLSVYPREEGLAPASSVAYLVKPSSPAAIGEALVAALGG
jgi:CheY-like chemotaxis protein